ncbi:MAG: cytochrome c biogenesis protein CcsA [Nitrospiraceae bacterium]|jgi:ABC-type transport system involved in cytochrome c biogenesis permease subunit|nr:MAG: cytochrome c biogenesis protein CcsA [Nitrospiraceae bacterium]
MEHPLTLILIIAGAFYIFGYYRRFFVYAGILFQCSYLLMRGAQLGRLPLVGPHDTLCFLSASIAVFAVPIAYRVRDRQRFQHGIVALVVFFMGLSLIFQPHTMPLPPVLRTFWFETHVAFSFFSYALFGIAAVLGVLSLTYDGGVPEEAQYTAILVGYSFFSLGMIFGGIWAYYAWGTYWLWTAKEVWTVMVWLFYGFYLHARLTSWWKGKPEAILGIIGFGIVLFTYLGVSLLMKSSHAF